MGKAVHRRLDALNEKMADLSNNAKRQTELRESIRNELWEAGHPNERPAEKIARILGR